MIKVPVAFNHAISSEMLPGVAKCQVSLVETKSAITLQAFQRLRQAVWIIVAKENCRALPEFAE